MSQQLNCKYCKGRGCPHCSKPTTKTLASGSASVSDSEATARNSYNNSSIVAGHAYGHVTGNGDRKAACKDSYWPLRGERQWITGCRKCNDHGCFFHGRRVANWSSTPSSGVGCPRNTAMPGGSLAPATALRRDDDARKTSSTEPKKMLPHPRPVLVGPGHHLNGEWLLFKEFPPGTIPTLQQSNCLVCLSENPPDGKHQYQCPNCKCSVMHEVMGEDWAALRGGSDLLDKLLAQPKPPLHAEHHKDKTKKPIGPKLLGRIIVEDSDHLNDPVAQIVTSGPSIDETCICGFIWLQDGKKGYRCAGGTHLVTHEIWAEGKGVIFWERRKLMTLVNHGRN